MRHGLFVGLLFFGGELAGALIELRGHIRRFVGRTAEHDEDLGEFGNFHTAVLPRPDMIGRIKLL